MVCIGFSCLDLLFMFGFDCGVWDNCVCFVSDLFVGVIPLLVTLWVVCLTVWVWVIIGHLL